MRMASQLKFALLVCGLLAGLAAEGSSLQQVLNRGELVVGTTLAAPWALRDDDGEMRGFEVDVVRKLAADMDVELVLRRYAHDALIRALESGEIDLIAAGFTITPERARHVNFSQPYSVGGIGMATNLDATADITRIEELNHPDFTVATVEGTVAADIAGRILPRARLERYGDEATAIDALVAGLVDIYLEQEPIPHFLALEHPGSIDVPVSRPLVETRSAFAVSKGDADFLAYLNAWIEAREADTWLPTTHQYWFRTLQWRE
jgi:polar amino acid transport system substrate-binding protein